MKKSGHLWHAPCPLMLTVTTQALVACAHVLHTCCTWECSFRLIRAECSLVMAPKWKLLQQFGEELKVSRQAGTSPSGYRHLYIISLWALQFMIDPVLPNVEVNIIFLAQLFQTSCWLNNLISFHIKTLFDIRCWSTKSTDFFFLSATKTEKWMVHLTNETRGSYSFFFFNSADDDCFTLPEAMFDVFYENVSVLSLVSQTSSQTENHGVHNGQKLPPPMNKSSTTPAKNHQEPPADGSRPSRSAGERRCANRHVCVWKMFPHSCIAANIASF